MNWQNRMREDEAQFKKLMDSLASVKGRGLKSHIERTLIMRRLDEKIDDARSYINDCLTGRNCQEKYMMQYQVRMQFPLYSHLSSLFTITPRVFPDRNCA